MKNRKYELIKREGAARQDKDAVTVAPYWSRRIHVIFKDAEKRIQAARSRGVHAAVVEARADALSLLFQAAATYQLTLCACYLDNSALVNIVLNRFFDDLGALEDDIDARSRDDFRYVFRHVRLTLYRQCAADAFVQSATKEATRELYNAFRNGLNEETRQYPHVELVE